MMPSTTEIIVEFLRTNWDLIKLFLIIVIGFIVLTIIFRLIKKRLIKKVRTKKQAANVAVFFDLLKYLFVFFFIIIVIFTYQSNWGELGFIAGLFSVALGLALQKPISGVFAWFIIVTRRPFSISDRISIKGILGDVTDISLTHIYLDEVGGTIDGEEGSGRTMIVPTSIIFEEEVINYTGKNDYILDEVKSTITYESNLKKAETIVKNSVKKIMTPYWEKFPKRMIKDPHTRLNFKDSGIDVIVRYNTIATQRNQISTDIRREIHNNFLKNKDVEFAYPHTEVLFRNK